MAYLNNLQRLRVKRGWSQRQTATMLGIDPSTLSLMERGQRLPSKDLIRVMRDIFGVEVGEIFPANRRDEKSE